MKQDKFNIGDICTWNTGFSEYKPIFIFLGPYFSQSVQFSKEKIFKIYSLREKRILNVYEYDLKKINSIK